MRKYYLLITLLIIATVFVRFNRQDLFIDHFTSGELTGDQIYYYKLINILRNFEDIHTVDAPFNSRLLPCLIAALLPFSADTALNLVNVFFLILGYSLTYKSMIDQGLSQSVVLWTTILFIISFPIFYYGAVGYVDPVIVSFLMIGLYYLFKEKYVLLCLIVFIGVFVKETIIILLIISILYMLLQKKNLKFYIWGLIFAYILGSVLLKLILIGNSVPAYSWLPSINTAWSNLSRPRTYLSLFATLLPICIVFITSFLSTPRQNTDFRVANELSFIASTVLGILISIAAYIYSIFSAYSDGRILWLTYPFVIHLSGYLIEKKNTFRAIKLLS